VADYGEPLEFLKRLIFAISCSDHPYWGLTDEAYVFAIQAACLPTLDLMGTSEYAFHTCSTSNMAGNPLNILSVHKGERGAALVETTVVLIYLMVLMFVGLEIGIIGYYQLAIDQASQIIL
jgi:hypothetical protein